MTYPDRTVYPVASPNTKDFYHLVGVYLDAVLAPTLEPWVLQREGWHVEVEEGGGGATPRLSLKGVVLNEMKGVYSNPDTAHGLAVDAALWPDTVYSASSGGDPAAIPSLSHAAFTRFHRTLYHPSTARLFFFGDDDPAHRLVMVENSLAEFGAAPIGFAAATVVPLQRLRTAPVRVRAPVPAPARAAPAETAAAVPLAHVPPPTTAPPEARPAGAPPQVSEPHPSLPASATPVDEMVANAGAAVTGAPSAPPCDDELSVSWVLNEAPLDETTRYGLGVLSHLLLRETSSTLRKALTDSGLGSSVLGGGVDGGLQQVTFSVGLKGVAPHRVDEVEALILSTLATVAKDGFTPAHVAATLHTIEFGMREFASGGGPRGLSLFLSIVPAWVYGRDPIGDLRFEGGMAALRAALAADPHYFQGLVQRYLLDNAHRATVHMFPDSGMTAAREAAESAALEKLAATLSPAELAGLASNAEALRVRQATPDSAEALAAIPTLQLSDVPVGAKRLVKRVTEVRLSEAAGAAPVAPPPPTATIGPLRGQLTHREARERGNGEAASNMPTWQSSSGWGGGSGSWTPPASPPASTSAEVLMHEQPTSGILYMNLYFDLSPLPVRLLPLVPLFTWALQSCGTAHTEEVAFAHAVGLATGGLDASASVLDVPGDPTRALPYLVVSGKALSRCAPDLARLMGEMVNSGRLDKAPRLLTAAREAASDHENGLISGGHSYARSVMGAGFTKPGWVGEVLGGLTNLHVSRALVAQLEGGGAGLDALLADLELIRRIVVSGDNVLVSLTGDAAALTAAQAPLEGLLASFPSAGFGGGGALPRARLASNWGWAPGAPPSAAEGDLPLSPLRGPTPNRLALVVPTAVNYVVKAAPVYPLGQGRPPHTPVPGDAEVVSGLLRTGYLWERVRVSGGAYGAYSSLNRASGVLGFASYRDPGLSSTLSTYDGVGAYLRNLASATPRAELVDAARKAVLATMGGVDAPLSPAGRGGVSTSRHLVGVSEADVDARRAEIMGTDFAVALPAFAAAADVVAARGGVAVVTSQEGVDAFHKAHPGEEQFVCVEPLSRA